MKRLASQSGLSLIETVLYVALFGILSIMLMNCLFVMMRTYTNTRANDDVLDSAQVSLERMTREIRKAASVTVSGSTFDATPGVLKLATTDASGAAETLQFSLSGTTLQLTTNGTLTGAISSSKVNVTSLVFRNITTPQGSAVRIEMTLQSSRITTKTATFYDTVALRDSY